MREVSSYEHKGIKKEDRHFSKKMDEELSKQIGGTRTLNNIENGRGNKNALVTEILERGLVLPIDIPDDTILNIFQECFPSVECANVDNAFTALFLLSAYSPDQTEIDSSCPNSDDLDVGKVIVNYLSHIGKSIKVLSAFLCYIA